MRGLAYAVPPDEALSQISCEEDSERLKRDQVSAVNKSTCPAPGTTYRSFGMSAAVAANEPSNSPQRHIFHGFILIDAALAGLGIAFLPEEKFGAHIEDGRLIRVLEPWCQPFPGYYRYYPTRKHPSPAFTLVVDALRVQRKRQPAKTAGSESA